MDQNSKKIKISALVSCFNGAKYLPAFLENCAAQTAQNEMEIVLVHNQPSPEELLIVKNFQAQHPNLLKHIVVQRELWDVSMNRAIRAAAGVYVCVWNVDDLRTLNSLELMAKTLDDNQSAGFTYGDFIIVRDWQGKQGRLIVTPEFNKRQFIQSMILGPFFMWRKNLCSQTGYWDEQLRTGGDFDFAARLAIVSEGIKTPGLLGYYLDAGLGLSTGKTPWQAIERTVIELRFGIYHKLDFWYYTRALNYRVNEILFDGVWHPMDLSLPQSRQFRDSKWAVVWALVLYPFWILRRIINRIGRIYRLS